MRKAEVGSRFMKALQHRSRRTTFRKTFSYKRKKDEKQEPLRSFSPRLNKEARHLLDDIGRPKMGPFIPDPFQMEALSKILKEDVVVSAPTGSGKTWIALQSHKKSFSTKA